MFFIIGLGNPGRKYEKSRHNAGFMAVDRFAASHQISVHEKSSYYEFGSGIVSGTKIVLVKPTTFMNRSGLAVRRIMDDYRDDGPELIVIHDDLDIPLGQIRIKTDGGAGGHNGISSVIEYLQSGRFTRIRIGIGRPREKEEVVDFVLAPFLAQESKTLEESIGLAGDAVLEILQSGTARAMNRFNQKA